MDPYLEQSWPDVHASLIGYIREALAPGLPENLTARMETSVLVEEDQDPTDRYVPDVTVIEQHGPEFYADMQSDSAVALAPPIEISRLIEPRRQRTIKIIDSDSQRVVTAIEVLSPWNKVGGGLASYLQKRDTYIAGKVSLVEIDLVRAGNWRTMLHPCDLGLVPVTTYRVSVHIGWNGRDFIYPVPINEPLPSIQIPLRKQDEQPILALQPLLDRAYQIGRYHKLDYTKPCVPPLTQAELIWLKGIVDVVVRKPS
jgi:hypothetical protein